MPVKKTFRHHIVYRTMLQGELESFGGISIVDLAIRCFDKLGEDNLQYLVRERRSLWATMPESVQQEAISLRDKSMIIKGLMVIPPIESASLFIEAMDSKRPEIASILSEGWVALTFTDFMMAEGF